MHLSLNAFVYIFFLMFLIILIISIQFLTILIVSILKYHSRGCILNICQNVDNFAVLPVEIFVGF